MCGRFVRHSPPSTYAELFGIDPIPGGPSFNVAPTQSVAAIRVRDGAPGRRSAAVGPDSRLVQGQEDQLRQRAVRYGFAEARLPQCDQEASMPGSGRWILRMEDDGQGEAALLFYMRDGRPFAFAGIWECWKGEEEPVETCALLTTEPNELARTVHDRMPVILPATSYEPWLDPSLDDPVTIQELMSTYPAAEMTSHPVTPAMGNVRHNGPECILLIGRVAVLLLSCYHEIR
jgi:putative SOS response-associated peptidase YedK